MSVTTAVTNPVTTEELASALIDGWSERNYRLVRQTGATHAEALEARRAFGLLIYGYVLARNGGVTHAELIAAGRKGIDALLIARVKPQTTRHYLVHLNRDKGKLDKS